MRNLIYASPKSVESYTLNFVNSKRRTTYKVEVPNTGNDFKETIYGLCCLERYMGSTTEVYYASKEQYSGIMTFKTYNDNISATDDSRNTNEATNEVIVNDKIKNRYKNILNYLKEEYMLLNDKVRKGQMIAKAKFENTFNLTIEYKKYSITEFIYAIYLNTVDGILPLNFAVLPYDSFESIEWFIKLDTISILNAVGDIHPAASINYKINTDVKEFEEYLLKREQVLNKSLTFFIDDVEVNACNITEEFIDCLSKVYKTNKKFLQKEKNLLLMVANKYVLSVLNAKFKTTFVEPKDIDEIEDYVTKNYKRKNGILSFVGQ